MKNYFSTLNSRLLLSYFLFVGLILSVMAFSWTLFDDYKHIKAYQDNISQLLVSQLKLYKFEKDFLNDEVKSSRFYTEGKSKNLAAMQKEVTFFVSKINEMQNFHFIKDSKLDISFRELQLFVQAYMRSTTKIVELYKIRGFKDFGLEGQLRSNIHDIENNFKDFNKIDLLTLRRIEKDYIIRKDSNYVLLMAAKQKEIFQKKYTKSDAQLSQKLENYFKLFFELARIENQIGLSQNNGLKARCETYFLKTTNSLTTIQNSTKQIEQQQYKKITYNFIIVVIFSIIIYFILSYIITKSIHKPIVELVEMMNKKQDYHYTNVPLFTSKTNIHEIKIIQNGYINMYKSICENVSELEIRNNNLQNLNHLLADTNEELKNRETELKNSDKLKAVFISIISHDIKSPLNTLKGFLDILIDYPNELTDTDKLAHFQKIRENTNLQINLLTNLLSWTNSQSQEIKIVRHRFQVADVVEDCVKLMEETSLNKNIRIINQIPHVELLSDKNMLALVFRNLISNAIKFSQKGGKITLDSELKSNNIMFSVIDSGVGIDKITLEKLNNSHEQITTKGTINEAGTGFGILFCKSFVAKLGGELKIFSTQNVGTTVYFSVPILAMHNEIVELEPNQNQKLTYQKM